MEIALKYEALKSEEVDVINAFTTDAQLAANNLVLLADDRVFFETYDAGTIVRKDALEKYPKLQGVLEKMNGLITEAEMQQMNYEVEVNGREDRDVAREFLENKGLLVH
jgi:glycine betaine/choline ABC-type transport system substrate-binding protein